MSPSSSASATSCWPTPSTGSPRSSGCCEPDIDPLVIRLCFEVADRFLEVAYRHELEGDDRVVAEGVEMIVAHLERYATPAGLTGIDAASVQPRWGVN